MWGDRGMSLCKLCGVYAGDGLQVSRIMITLSACCVTNHDHAIGMADQVCMAIAGVTLLFWMAVCRGVHAINGTPPGVLFLVTCWWTCGVVLTAHLAIGLWDAMMAGASMMCCRVMIGVSSITLCCSALTFCSTLCSVAAAGRGGGGVSIFPICNWSNVSKCRLLVVVPTIVPLAANSSVSLWSVDGVSTLATGNAGGTTQSTLKCGMPKSQGCNIHCPNSDWGKAKVPSVDSPGCPQSPCVFVFMHYCLATQRCERISVPIVWPIESFVRQYCRVDSQGTYHVEGVLDLPGQSIS